MTTFQLSERCCTIWNVSQRSAESRAAEPAEANRVVGADRVLATLAELAVHPDGIALDDLARVLHSPKPTVHRALASLRRAGFATQNGPGHYVLGDEFLRLAFSNHEARPDHVRVLPVLEELAARFHETAHYAVLDGGSVVYRSKVDPSVGAMKLTSVIGGRNPAHCTAVGKLLLSFQLSDDAAVHAWVAGQPELARRTPSTKVDAASLAAELAITRARGYATEEQENEIGISCLALPVFATSMSIPSGAISISALIYRTPLSSLVEALPEIRAIASPLGAPVGVS
jgi:IclR family transcriptional regulator, acetate operon repressor